MSWWVSLYQLGTSTPVQLDTPHVDGGTYQLGGTRDARLNITYNYSALFRRTLHEDGLRWLNGKTGAETLLQLNAAIAILGTKRDADYWKSTPGNAGRALALLAAWAHEYPDAVFVVNG